ncbi:MAG: hypothetical protein PHY09_12000 [Desulfuromonadaceae bacterium]|nr:hypothetical protein [Desulfuromonadaceae bacterium]MDD5107301.1 hypothetical protein [Desulfuromonadaceae bacterium]
MDTRDSNSLLEEDVCGHIFTVSAAMVGVCMTVIGILRLVITIQKINTLADDFLAVDALLFLTSCILSYLALRSRGYTRMHRIERIADGIFILGLLGMGAICVFTVYEFAVV